MHTKHVDSVYHQQIKSALKSRSSKAIKKILDAVQAYVRQASGDEKARRIRSVLASQSSNAIKKIVDDLQAYVKQASGDEKVRRIRSVLTSQSSNALKKIVDDIQAYVKQASGDEKVRRIESVLASRSSDALKKIVDDLQAYVQASGNEKVRRIESVLASQRIDAIKKIVDDLQAYVREASGNEKVRRIESVLASQSSNAIKKIVDDIQAYVKQASGDEKAWRIESVLASRSSYALKKIVDGIQSYVREASGDEKALRIKFVLTSRCCNIQSKLTDDDIRCYLNANFDDVKKAKTAIKTVVNSRIDRERCISLLTMFVREKNFTESFKKIVFSRGKRSRDKILKNLNHGHPTSLPDDNDFEMHNSTQETFIEKAQTPQSRITEESGFGSDRTNHVNGCHANSQNTPLQHSGVNRTLGLWPEVVITALSITPCYVKIEEVQTTPQSRMTEESGFGSDRTNHVNRGHVNSQDTQFQHSGVNRTPGFWSASTIARGHARDSLNGKRKNTESVQNNHSPSKKARIE